MMNTYNDFCINKDEKGNLIAPLIHLEEQDTETDAWKRLNDIINKAAAKNYTSLLLNKEMPWHEYCQIKTLPPIISKLKSVEIFMFYGSKISRVPPEIGQMENLIEFIPYTSYLLHWFPYEITECKNLLDSTISTRALYGNHKFRTPFPKLPVYSPAIIPDNCSVCKKPLNSIKPIQRWISLNIGTDIVPLLVNACSMSCIESLPKPASNYVPYAHNGGADLEQPPPYF